MTETDILATLKPIMADVFDVNDSDINEKTSADDIEEWDSLSHIRLIVAVEQKFKFKFKNSEIESLKNVGELVHLIATKTT